MTLGQQFKFAPRLMWREWKSGEFTVLLLALVVAIASHTAIGHFTDRISRAMITNANNLIGGDLVFSSSRPIDQAATEKAQNLGLNHTSTQRFHTVASAGDEILLVSVKSVGEHYPLKGSLRITEELFGPEIVI
nr:ABC transporter permease [Granulosicoccus sp.]